jgi:hypothetical protein
VSFLYNSQKDRKLSTTFVSDEVTTTTASETTESSSVEQSSTTSTTTTSELPEPEAQKTSGGGGSKTNVGAIVGGTIGGFVVLSLLVLGIIWFMRRNKKNGDTPPPQPAIVPQPPVPQTPADTVPPMSQHYAKSGVTSPTQSEWRDSMVTTQSPGSPVSNMTWTGQYPAGGPEVYHEMPQGGSYGR